MASAEAFSPTATELQRRATIHAMNLLATAPQAGPDAGSPLVALVALSYLAVYAYRWRQCRKDPSTRSPGFQHLLAFAAGCALMGLALGPPLDRWAEQSSTMHMVQHVILLDLVPILLFAGLTKALLRPITRRVHGVESKVGVVALPVFAVVLYVGLMYFWHFPFAYNAALKNANVHALEHVTLLTAGLFYWWHLMSPVRIRTHLSGTGPSLYMAVTKVLVGLLGVVLAFSPRSLYDYSGTFLGMNPLVDQHVAGLVMATEQTIVMGIAFAVVFVKMLGASEREQQKAEQYSGAAQPRD